MSNRPGQGRKPLPSNVLKLRGTERAHRVNHDEPMPGADDIDMPPGMAPSAAEHWPYMLGLLDEMGVVTNVDVVALRMLCEAYDEYQRALKGLEAGLLVKDRHGMPKASPYVSIVEKTAKRVHSLLAEFGMTPSARRNVAATSPQATANDWDAL